MAYLIAKPRGKQAKAVSQVLQHMAEATTPSVGEGGLNRLIPLAARSRELLAIARPLLPAALAAQVQAGKLDADGWTLVAPNGAAAAKLQQLRPQLERQLAERGVKISAIRIRVQGSG